jgi:hypothetical protein
MSVFNAQSARGVKSGVIGHSRARLVLVVEKAINANGTSWSPCKLFPLMNDGSTHGASVDWLGATVPD